MGHVNVSIIVPVYNVEMYLKQCLDSLVNQTMQEIEIICVNDGSTDNSLQILKDYAKKDKRIKIIDKENEGQGVARNKGMEIATGEYIGFVDSDDWLNPNMYEKLYRNAKSNDSDMVMCPIQLFDNITGDFKYDDPYYTLECFDNNYDEHSFNHVEAKDFFFKICVTPFNKIYKSKFLDKIPIKFPESLIFEDNPFFYESFLNADRVSLIREFLYYYRVNRDDSTVTRSKNFKDIVEIHKITRKIFKQTNTFEFYKESLMNYVIRSIFHRYNLTRDEYKKEFYKLIKKDFKGMDLDEINALNPKTREKYQNIMNSGSYEKFLMLEGLNTESTHYKKIKSDMTLTKGGLSKIKSFLKEPTKKQIRKTGMVRELQIDKQKLKIQNKNLTNEVSRLKTQIEELRRENQISERSSYSLKKTLRGISADVGKLAIIQYVLENVDKKTRILDVGLGSGVYGKLLRAFYYRNIDGIDVHGENIDELGLDVIYDNIYIENILDFDFEHYDLIIFGDVLEHIVLELAKNLLERFIEEDKCENIIVSIPFEYEQDEMYGNLHEIHLQPDVNSEYMKKHYPYLKLIDESIMPHNGGILATYVWKKKENSI